LQRAFEQSGVPFDARAEAVSLAQFVELTRHLSAGENLPP
jgi:hypothetical protein